MRFANNGPGGKKHPCSPDTGGTFESRPAPCILQDPQVAQLPQTFDQADLSTEHESHVQYYGHHISDWSNYPSQMTTHSGQINHWDDSFIHAAVAAGSTFPDIIAVRFHNREDITPEILEDYAQKTGAIWTDEDDELLRCLRVNQNELPTVLANLRECWLPWRNVDAIRARINYQMNLRKYTSNSTPVKGVFRSEQHYGYDTELNHSDTSGDPMAALRYSNPEQHASLPQEVYRGFPDHSTSSAPSDYTNNNLMNLYNYGYENVQTEGSTQYNIVEDAKISPTLSDSSDYLDAEPFVSLPAEVNQSFVGSYSSSADKYHHSDLMGRHENQYLNTPNEVSPQVQQYRDDSVQADVWGLPRGAVSNLMMGQPSSQSGAVSQSLAGARTSTAQPYYGLQAAPSPNLVNESGDQEQGCSGTVHGWQKWPRLPMEKYDLIKLRFAEGLSISQIVRQEFPDRTVRSLECFIYSNGWKGWSQDQDINLLALQRDLGNDWGEISRRLPGPPRSREEVEIRSAYWRNKQRNNPVNELYFG